jgi:hypothetical protein
LALVVPFDFHLIRIHGEHNRNESTRTDVKDFVGLKKSPPSKWE